MAGPAERLAWELRRLRDQAGRPSYRELAQHAHFSRSTLAEAATGMRLPTLEATLAYAVACGGDRAEWERRWHLAADEVERARRRSPYPGLVPLGAADADLFFGREQLLEDLLKAVQRASLTVVAGASGSGKSSLLGAGLLAKLTAEGTSARLVTPGAHPVYEDGDDAVLVIDQFEEVFTLVADDRERDAFLDRLTAVAAAGAGPALVIGVRADFYERCVRHPGLVTAFRDSVHVPVGPMDERELRAVVAEPAAKVGLQVEPDLVAAVQAEAAGQAGALPMVAHALRETWSRERGNTLRLAGYRAAGGVAGAIAQTAERLWTGLDEAQRDLLRTVLLRLTAPGDGTADTRRKIDRDELTGIGPAGELDTVLDRLAAARLIVLDRNNTTRDDAIEIAHEALIYSWPRLREWLDHDRDARLRHQRLTRDAADWERDGHGEDHLYRGDLLAAWDTDTADHSPLNELERSFLAASRVQGATVRRRKHLTIGGLSVTAAAMGVLLVLVLVQTGNAGDASDRATSVRLAGEARDQLRQDPELALLLAIEAYEAGPTPEADIVLRQATVDARLRGSQATGLSRVDEAATSPDGRKMAIWGSGPAPAALEIWDLSGPAPRRDELRVPPSGTQNIKSAAFSPDGRRLATGNATGRVAVWDLAAASEQPTVLGTAPQGVLGLSVSRSGQVASAHADGVRLWSPAGRAPTELPGRSVAFSPSGRRLATGGGGSPLRIWSLTKDRPKPERTAARGEPDQVAFAPSGPWAATVQGGVPQVWDVLTGRDREWEPQIELPGHAPRQSGLAFSRGAERMATYGADGLIRVWTTGADADPLTLHTRGNPRGVAFTDTSMVSVQADGTLRQWDVTTSEPAPAQGRPLALSSDTKTVVTSAAPTSVIAPRDIRLRVWRGSDVTEIKGPRDSAYQIALSPDGRRMAGLGRSGTLTLWDLSTGASTTAPAGLRGLPSMLTFSPDGKRLAAGATNTDPQVWEISPGLKRLTGWETQPTAKAGGTVAFNADGTLLADARDDGTVLIWNLTGRHEPKVMRGNRDDLTGLAFGPDGRRLAAAATDGAIRVWDTRGEAAEPTVLRGPVNRVRKVRFSPDGAWLLTNEPTGNLRLWRPPGGDPVELTGWGATGGLAAFTPDGKRIVRGLSPQLVGFTGLGPSLTRTRACEVCAPADDVLTLAKSRRTRGLTAEERRTHHIP
ncbi:MAG: helix-turn-helix domain-containing protein [Spirillospora sp.]